MVTYSTQLLPRFPGIHYIPKQVFLKSLIGYKNFLSKKYFGKSSKQQETQKSNKARAKNKR